MKDEKETIFQKIFKELFGWIESSKTRPSIKFDSIIWKIYQSIYKREIIEKKFTTIMQRDIIRTVGERRVKNILTKDEWEKIKYLFKK